MITTFLLAWTPYALCVFVLSANGYVHSNLYCAAAIFAKMSSLYNPIIYICFTNGFRAHCKAVFGCRSNAVVPLVDTSNVVNSLREGTSSRIITSSIAKSLKTTDAVPVSVVSVHFNQLSG